MSQTTSISDFLARKGAMEIFVAIEMWDSTRHSDFRDNIDLAPNTLSSRLSQGEEFGLWRRSEQHYELTELGHEIFETVPAEELFYLHEKKRNKKQRIDILEQQALLDIPEGIGAEEE